MKNAALIAALLLVACAGPNTWHPYNPATGATAKSGSAALVHAGLEVDTDANGTTASRWFHGEGFATETNEFRIVVTVTNGAYTIEAQCRAHDHGTCDDTRRPQFVLDDIAKTEAGMK